jgi:predicted flavoprotein YhiN
MPQAIADMICQMSLISPITPMANIGRVRRNLIVEHVKSLPATVTRTEGFDKAIVTRGGVELKQVDPRTLASRLVAGLHFAGELLDLDGPCGGYNLQWAFSSGNLAGRSAASGR